MTLAERLIPDTALRLGTEADLFDWCGNPIRIEPIPPVVFPSGQSARLGRNLATDSVVASIDGGPWWPFGVVPLERQVADLAERVEALEGVTPLPTREGGVG